MTKGTILRHIQPSVDFAKVIDRHYVRLVEPGSVLGLPAEPFLKDPVIFITSKAACGNLSWHTQTVNIQLREAPGKSTT
jgi:hypothetical protein